MFRRKKAAKKLIAYLLSACLIFTTAQGFAASAQTDTIPEGENITEVFEPEQVGTPVSDDILNSDYQNTAEEAVAVSEIVEGREPAVKKFLMSDHTTKAVIYSQPVHYQEDGEWKDIDNTLEYKASDEVYVNKANSFSVELASKADSKEMATVVQDQYSVSWGLHSSATSEINASQIMIDRKDQLEIKSLQSQAIALEKDVAEEATELVTQKVLYPGVQAGVDFEYILTGTGLKENIILANSEGGHVYTFAFTANHLNAEKLDDGSISLKAEDTGREIFVINAPFMFDADGQSSYDVYYDLEKNGDDEYQLTLTADPDWIKSPDRAFPVTIDPVITTKTARANIDTTFITSSKATTNHSNKLELLVGKESSEYGNCRTLVKFVMPGLQKGDMVVDATMHIANYWREFYASTTPDLQINAHMITSSWSHTSVTWNSNTSFESTALDFDYLKRADGTKPVWKNFNITKAVKKWYENEAANYGIILKSFNESGSNAEVGVKGYLWPERYNDQANAYPVISIVYRNNKGLEDYWSYTSLGAGTAGVAHINDYTGNLVFIHNDVSTTGLLMPISLNHVYNGYMAGDIYSTVKPKVGKGWRLNMMQTVKPSTDFGLSGEEAERYPYVYTDGDGTNHFFYEKPVPEGTINPYPFKYDDEDGLNIKLNTLVAPAGCYEISDDKDNIMKFNAKGNIISIKDANGNTATVQYASDNETIQSVKDGAGHVVTITPNPNGSGYLQKVKDPAGRETTYLYSDSLLTRVEYPDGTSSYYTYDSDGAMTSAKSSDGYKLEFEYTTLAKGKRVSKVVEYGGSSVGQTMTFDRSKYNTTVIRTAGTDGVFNNSDDVLTTLQFDNAGRTVSTQSQAANGYQMDASMYTFTAATVDSTGSNIKQLNRVSSSGSTGKNITNLAKNHSAERDGDWRALQWIDDCTFTFTRSTEQKYIGANSFKMVSTAVNGDARARAYQDFQAAGIKPGGTYTFSAYVKTSGITQANPLSGGYGACLAIYVNAPTTNTVFSEYVTGTTDTAMDNGWRRISVTVTLPTDVVYMRANLAIRNATGTAYFDAIQVENATSANKYNMLENAGFEEVSGGLPTRWQGFNLTSSDVVTTSEKHEGAQSFKIIGKADTPKQLYQEVSVSGSESDTYIVSGWAKGSAVMATNSDRKFKISVLVTYSDGSTVWKTAAEFNTTIADWQYSAQSFNLDDGTSTVKTPVKITVYPRFFNQANIAYFDNMQLVKEVAQTYKYNSDGKLISMTENTESSSSMIYDGADLTSVTNAKGYIDRYEYDSKHNLTLSKSQRNVQTQYTRNSKGQATTVAIENTGGTMRLETGSSYTAASGGIAEGAYLKNSYDADGHSTEYTYNLQKGTLTSVKDPKGSTTTYEYNANTDDLTKVSKAGVSNSFTYDNNRLDTITHNGFSYSFVYDTYGNRTQTKVGSQVLSTSTYGANNGNLQSVVYENGYTESYGYNSNFGYLSALYKNGSKKFTWSYNQSMLPYIHDDLENGLIHVYGHDNLGRLVHQRTSDRTKSTNVDRMVYETEFAYDVLGNITRFCHIAGGRRKGENYAYGQDNLPTTYTMSPARYQTYTFDSINRLTKTTMSTDTPFDLNYVYLLSERDQGSGLYRTTKVRQEILGNDAYRYSYDDLGNITKIEQGVRNGDASGGSWAEKLSYTYDVHNQLTRENNLYTNKTTVYTYDAGGNILKKEEYPYTTGTLGTPTNTVPYTYGNTNWKDLLTSYNGTAITYDEIGNPESYRGYTMGWEGRQLKTLSGNGLTASYQYDAGGLRTRKTVNGVTSQYQYVGGQLRYEKRGDIEFYYAYNSFGALSRIIYYLNGTEYTYYPVCNMRGDVEAIYSGGGELRVRYTYDTWGNVVSVTDGNGADITSSTHIGLVNPIRYRGYYYDAETGMYYLQSRYYDPQVGRFISADSVAGNTSNSVFNLFAYCSNNPVNASDPSGHCYEDKKNNVYYVCPDHEHYYGNHNSYQTNKKSYVTTTEKKKHADGSVTYTRRVRVQKGKNKVKIRSGLDGKSGGTYTFIRGDALEAEIKLLEDEFRNVNELGFYGDLAKIGLGLVVSGGLISTLLIADSIISAFDQKIAKPNRYNTLKTAQENDAGMIMVGGQLIRQWSGGGASCRVENDYTFWD